MNDSISRQAEIDAYIMKCPYFAEKNTINRSNIGTHIGSCDLEHHYRKVCPSNECICAERLGLKMDNDTIYRQKAIDAMNCVTGGKQND